MNAEKGEKGGEDFVHNTPLCLNSSVKTQRSTKKDYLFFENF